MEVLCGVNDFLNELSLLWYLAYNKWHVLIIIIIILLPFIIKAVSLFPGSYNVLSHTILQS